MSEHRDSYLLPCTCGESIIIQLRHAGETVRCRCGRESTAPTLGEIRRLRPAEAPKTTTAPHQWGRSQRFLLVGSLLMAVAATLAGVFIWYPHNVEDRDFSNFVEYKHDRVLALKPWDAIVYYRYRLEPGIDVPNKRDYQSRRERYLVGITVAGVLGATGAILVAFGAAGLVRKQDAP